MPGQYCDQSAQVALVKVIDQLLEAILDSFTKEVRSACEICYKNLNKDVDRFLGIFSFTFFSRRFGGLYELTIA